MTPQDHFMVVAPIAAGREPALRALLRSMNTAPGSVDANNAVVPFAAFARLHFARLVLIDDALQVDLEVYGVARKRLPTYLVFMGDCDGPAHDCLADLARRAAIGLRSIFAHCEGFLAGVDLRAWMIERDVPAQTRYVNWVGRTVLQIREESALQRALAARVPRATNVDVQRVRRDLLGFVAAEVSAGRLQLTPPEPTPLAWQLAQIANLILVPLIGLVLTPLLIVLLPCLAWRLRSLETGDAEICPRPRADDLAALQELEDHDVSNQYTALGAVKPGLFRRTLLSMLLLLADYACRHVFTHGFLARVQTIHFAHWVFLDDKTRVVFTSNYDGSHQGYMDDFINKVGWGLNLIFSNGVGWPRTRWLISGGSRIEQRFKYYQRRHQVPTQVWYKAYPALALVDLKRNTRIRAGLEQRSMSDAEALAWLKLL